MFHPGGITYLVILNLNQILVDYARTILFSHLSKTCQYMQRSHKDDKVCYIATINIGMLKTGLNISQLFGSVR